MNKKKITILMFITIFLVSIVMVSTADTNDRRWTHDAKYYIHPTYAYYSHTHSGVADWNGALNSINSTFDIVIGTSTDADITFYEGYYGSVPWNATTYSNYTNDEYNYATITYNRLKMNNYTAEKNRAIACHEMGHAIGQSHTVDSSILSVMYSSSSIFYDVNGVYYPMSYDKLYLSINY